MSEPGARLTYEVVTIFPNYLAPLDLALVGRACARGIVEPRVHDLRDWTHDVHRSVDDSPFGGGPGMVMKPEVWGEALDALLGPAAAPGGTGTAQDDTAQDDDRPLVLVPSPAGRPFTQADAHRYARRRRLIVACGRYEGIDQRVVDELTDRPDVDVEEVSLGDFVLIGGELAALAIAEAVIRLLPGVLGNQRSHEEDSFSDGLLEGPSYTRPESWRGRAVPEVLTSGDHARVARWRRDESLRRTAARRPELLASVVLDARDREVLDSLTGTPVTGTEPDARPS